jgi:hypothetical protein
MNSMFQRLKHELLSVIPPAVFFFISFQLLAFTRSLILKNYGIEVSTFVAATIGALIVAKVVLIVDLLPFVNRFPEKPLLYNIVWKTSIYLVAALIVRYGEHLFDFIRRYGDIAEANRRLLAEVVWPHFMIVQLWLLVLFLMYCTLRELIRVLGREQVRTMFLGPVKPKSV